MGNTVAMGNIRNPGLGRLATLGLCGLGLMSAALAAPPGSQRGPPGIQRGAAHLDLRPAMTLHPAMDLRPAMAVPEKTSAAFPSSLHRQTLAGQEQLQLPDLGSDSGRPHITGSQPRTMGGAEEFARRVHREGLPVARLWENKSALVSLGLNQRGKPGLWIIQKIH
jgi:hypothetical protein